MLYAANIYLYILYNTYTTSTLCTLAVCTLSQNQNQSTQLEHDEYRFVCKS